MDANAAVSVLVVLAAVLAAVYWQLPGGTLSPRVVGLSPESLLVLQEIPLPGDPTALLKAVVPRMESDGHGALRDDAKMRWGTFRSGLYFGVRSRTFPFFVSSGLLWTSQHEDLSQLRHWSRQEDRLQKYTWLQHNGRDFGRQMIEDQHNRVQINTTFLALNGDNSAKLPSKLLGVNGWASRVQVRYCEPRDRRYRNRQLNATRLSLFFYVDLGCEDDSLDHMCRQSLISDLIDVQTQPTACAKSKDPNRHCTRMRIDSTFSDQAIKQNKAYSPSSNQTPSKYPLSFAMELQLNTHKRVQLHELRFTGRKRTNVLNVREQIFRMADFDPATYEKQVLLDNIVEDGSTLLLVQAIVEEPSVETRFEPNDVLFDVIFHETESQEEGHDVELSSQLDPKVILKDIVGPLAQRRAHEFDASFEEVFRLKQHTSNFNDSQIAFAKAAFSNLMGGIGYFYGSSLIEPLQQEQQQITRLSAPKPLFTAVPSRSFFPRGFLWDEGFHQLGILPFDSHISREVLAHWLHLMEPNGYIPREQILGELARARVPKEFLVQHELHANPPTLLLVIDKMMSSASGDVHRFLKQALPYVCRWYQWFLSTQFGQDPNTFRWRGRNAEDGKLVANTLASGLDDYPRAIVPSEEEKHVDLLCWMLKFNEILTKMIRFVYFDDGKVPTAKKDTEMAIQVGQWLPILKRQHANWTVTLKQQHWHPGRKAFFDFGRNSEQGEFIKHVVVRCRNDDDGSVKDIPVLYEAIESHQVQCPASHPRYLFPLGDGSGGLKTQEVFVTRNVELQHVERIGYVTLFPLLLKILPPYAPELGSLLAFMTSERHLWTPHGLRSLSSADKFFEKPNAAGDEPYWRGAIWININYLALDALHHYKNQHGPLQKEMTKTYEALRQNVLDTIYREYERTGFLWEQYNGNPAAPGKRFGQGQRCHPFSGWTALVVNIMAEKF